MSDINSELSNLLSKQEITEQIYTYCRAVDRIDLELGKRVWHPDGVADYGAHFRGSGAGFMDYVKESHEAKRAHSHQISNLLIKVAGDLAASESYVTATLIYEEGDLLKQAIVQGRYLDRWSRRDGRWAIDHRQFLQDIQEVRSVNLPLGASWGDRNTADPSYAAFDGVGSPRQAAD